MLPYWLLFVLFAAGALLTSGRPAVERHDATFPFTLACLATVAMIGLRLDVGGDRYHYLEFYERMNLYPLVRAIRMGDPAYALLNWTVRQADLGMWLVNTVCAAIFVTGLAKFALRQPNQWLAVLIAVPYLIIVVAMGYTRQAAAIGLVMWGLAAFDRGRVRPFAVSVLGAVTFHLTAIAMLPLGIMSVTRNKFITSLMMLLLTATLYLIFVQGSVDRLVSNYVVSGYSSQGALVRVAMNVPPAIIFLLARQRFALSPESLKLWTNIAVAALVLLGLLAVSNASTAIDRLALYVIPLQIMTLSRMPTIFGRTVPQALLVTAALVLYSAAILFVWLNFAQHAFEWLPYNNYLWD